MLFAVGDVVLACGHGKFGGLHDQAVFVDPPIVDIEPPARRRDVARFGEEFVEFEPDADWSGINAPKAPGFSTRARCFVLKPEGGDVLHALETAELALREGRGCEECERGGDKGAAG